MAMNRVQFQRGLSMAEFMDRMLPMRVIECAWKATGKPKN